jgi:hypothetical protein
MAGALLAEDRDRDAQERAQVGISDAEAEAHRQAFDAAVEKD